MGISAEEAQAAGLSQEEVDAINGVDADQDDDALAEIAGDATDEGDDGYASDESGDSDEEGSDSEGGEEEGADLWGGSEAGAGDSAGDAGDAGDAGSLFDGIEAPTDVPFTPRLTGDLLPEYSEATEKAYDAADARIEAIEQKYADGELDEREKRAEVRKIERERDLEIRKISAASHNAELEAQKWEAHQQAFFRANKAYTQPLLFNALNAEVIRIANLPESAGKSGIEVLLAAKRSVDRQLMAVTGKAPDSDTQSKPPKPKAGRPDVQTLGGVPAAAAADTGGDKWAWLDKLSGMQYEAALAKLSEADQAAYAASR